MEKTNQLDNTLKEQKNLTSRYNVTWHIGAVKFNEQHKSSLSLALCDFSKGVAFISAFDVNGSVNADALRTMLINDVYVGNKCEGATRCFCLSCTKNEAALSQFQEYDIKDREQLQRIHQTLEKIKTDLELGTVEHGKIVYHKEPAIFKIQEETA